MEFLEHLLDRCGSDLWGYFFTPKTLFNACMSRCASVTVLSLPIAVPPMLAQATEVRAASSTNRYLKVVMIFMWLGF